MIALLLAAQAAVAPPAPPTPAPPTDEIIVTARRGKCEYRVAGEVMDNRAFDQLSTQWAAGRAVRVVTPPGADRKCLVKIAFRLADRGVKLIEFVDPPERP